MSKKNLFILVAIFVFICISSANAKLFGAEEFYLDNGMQVIVIPNHKAPIIKHMVWYKIGSADDKLGKAGTAHLLEHIMFRGTSKIKDSEFNSIISQYGGDSNAFTGYDFTAYHQSLDISKLELAMYLEADRMQNLKISKDSFYKERDVVFQERMQTVENSPFSYFGEIFRHNLWQNHPYGRPIIGSSLEIMSIEPDDLKRFYKSYYAPNNAILILSGDIDVETAKVLANKYYGGIAKREIGEKARFIPVGEKREYRLSMELPQVNNVRIIKSYITPSFSLGKKESAAFVVLSKYLGEGDTSKLYKDLVLNKKVAVGVSTSYNPSTRSFTTFSISAVPADKVTPEKMEEEIYRSLNKAIAQIDEKEIELVKEKMMAGLVYLRDNPNEAGYIVGHMATVGYSLEEIETYDEMIKAVSYKDVINIAKAMLAEATTQVGVLKPKEMK